MYGRAAYVAERAAYSHGYRYQQQGGGAQMFLVQAAAGRVYEPPGAYSSESTKTRHAPEGYDCIRADVGGPGLAYMVRRCDLSSLAFHFQMR